MYLKDNNKYWFFGFIPIGCNVWGLGLSIKAIRNNDIPGIGEGASIYPQPSYGVVAILMALFTMLTRQAYYHRQPDEFIGPRFIILSLQGSIILILLDFVLEKVRKQESLLDYKDVLTRLLLDFVDIFNMVEVLSVNACVGVGSYISEDSSTERAIQAFCTISFAILLLAQDIIMFGMIPRREREPSSSREAGDILYSWLTQYSAVYQDIPFLVIRIVV